MRFLRKISQMFLLTFVLCMFGACSLFYNEMAYVGGFRVGYSTIINKAFICEYNWNGEDQAIIIPDLYEDKDITALGGYMGRGFPCPFSINVTDYLGITPERGCAYKDLSVIVGENVVERYYDFELYIGANVKSIYADDTVSVVQEENQTVAYVCRVKVFCDEKNETFYSSNGILYYAENDMRVEGLIYFED